MILPFSNPVHFLSEIARVVTCTANSPGEKRENNNPKLNSFRRHFSDAAINQVREASLLLCRKPKKVAIKIDLN